MYLMKGVTILAEAKLKSPDSAIDKLCVVGIIKHNGSLRASQVVYYHLFKRILHEKKRYISFAQRIFCAS